MKEKPVKKHKGGRPPKITDVQKLAMDIERYFELNPMPTLSGLALFLGMDRQTLANYEKKTKFFGTIKRARDRMMAIYEEKLVYGTTPTGVIFALKNFGWKDKQEVDAVHTGELIVKRVSYKELK